MRLSNTRWLTYQTWSQHITFVRETCDKTGNFYEILVFWDICLFLLAIVTQRVGIKDAHCNFASIDVSHLISVYQFSWIIFQMKIQRYEKFREVSRSFENFLDVFRKSAAILNLWANGSKQISQVKQHRL